MLLKELMINTNEKIGAKIHVKGYKRFIDYIETDDIVNCQKLTPYLNFNIYQLILYKNENNKLYFGMLLK